MCRAIEGLRKWAENYQSVSVEEAQGGMVLFTFGQSNSANHGVGKYQPEHQVYNYFEASSLSFFRSTDWSDWLRASVWNRLADKLIDEKITTKVTLVPIGVGGVEIAAWAKGGYLYDKLTQTIALLKEQGLIPDYILWHQGETDNIKNTSKEEYIRQFETIREAFRS